MYFLSVSLQVTGQEGLPVCVDIHPVPDSSKVVVLWEMLPSAECSTTVFVEDEPISVMTELRGRGVALSDIVSNKRYDVSVACREDGGKRKKMGSLNFQTGLLNFLAIIKCPRHPETV